MFFFVGGATSRHGNKRTTQTRQGRPRKGATWKEGRAGQENEERNCCNATNKHTNTKQRAKDHGFEKKRVEAQSKIEMSEHSKKNETYTNEIINENIPNN